MQNNQFISRRTLSKWLLPVIPIAAFLIVWQALSKAAIINPALFPTPTDIIDELVALHTRELPTQSLLIGHISATLKRMIIGSLIGFTLGIGIGLLIGISQPAYRFFDPLITLVMPIPGIAMAPLFIIWLGFGDPAIIALGAIATFFPVVYNTSVGVRSIDMQLVRAAQIVGTNRLGILLEVYLPWAAGHMLIGAKLGIARGWRTIIAVEFIAAASWGLGYMIWDASEYLRAGLVYGGILLLIVIYLIMEKGIINTIERYTIQKWGFIES